MINLNLKSVVNNSVKLDNYLKTVDKFQANKDLSVKKVNFRSSRKKYGNTYYFKWGRPIQYDINQKTYIKRLTNIKIKKNTYLA